MKLLIVDSNTQTQAICGRRIESFNPADTEMLDLKVKLVSEREFAERVHEADVLVIGSGVAERGVVIARQAMAMVPWLHIIMFVSDEAYGGGAFRAAHSVGVRKVFPDSASPLDFLQELVAIHTEFRREGRAREGRVITLAQAKGGVGATSVAAALAEVCSVYGRTTLLWDLDVETRDLSRALTVSGSGDRIVNAWINGSRELTRESLKDAIISISSEVSVLMPPDKMAESMDFVCHTDGIGIVQRILELARVVFDVIIVDTAGRLGPATGALLRNSDSVGLVIDDSILGLTAVDLYLNFVKTLVGGVDRLAFVLNSYSGAMLGIPQIAAELEPAHKLGDAPWRLPPIPNDPRGAKWPGTGRTLYGLGGKPTRSALEKIARELQMIDAQSRGGFASAQPQFGSENTEQPAVVTGTAWLGKLLRKKGDSPNI